MVVRRQRNATSIAGYDSYWLGVRSRFGEIAEEENRELLGARSAIMRKGGYTKEQLMMDNEEQTIVIKEGNHEVCRRGRNRVLEWFMPDLAPTAEENAAYQEQSRESARAKYDRTGMKGSGKNRTRDKDQRVERMKKERERGKKKVEVVSSKVKTGQRRPKRPTCLTAPSPS